MIHTNLRLLHLRQKFQGTKKALISSTMAGGWARESCWRSRARARHVHLSFHSHPPLHVLSLSNMPLSLLQTRERNYPNSSIFSQCIFFFLLFFRILCFNLYENSNFLIFNILIIRDSSIHRLTVGMQEGIDLTHLLPENQCSIIASLLPSKVDCDKWVETFF